MSKISAEHLGLQVLYNDYYNFLFDKVIEEQMTINYSQKVIAKESKLSVRSVTPYIKIQVNFLNGNQYYGDLYDNRMCGTGRYLWSYDGNLYEGDFKKLNQIDGRGTYKFKNSESSTGFTKYCGSFVNGMYHGKGSLTNYFFKYNGNFENNQFNGKGNLKSGVESFDGCFLNDRKVCGKRIYSNGTYVGAFDEHELRKCGKYEFDNGDVYCGNYLANDFNGYGEYTWHDDVHGFVKTYYGFWKKNQRHGIGMLQFNGTTMMTMFKENVKTGCGIVWTKNGKIYGSHEMFKNDEYVDSLEIDINQENVEILKKLLNRKELLSSYYNEYFFISSVGKLLNNRLKTCVEQIYPFHLCFFELKVEHERIWRFVRTVPGCSIAATQEYLSMKQSIREHLQLFEELYGRYGNYCSKLLSNTSCCMTRFGLWQLFRDIGLYKKDVLFNTQMILETAEKDFNILVLNAHDPNETVSLCNLIQYLMFLTLYLNEHDEDILSCAINQKSTCFGMFATMFTIFIREFLIHVMSLSLFDGLIPKLIQEDMNFYSNFCAILNVKCQKRLSIRSVFQIVQRWKKGKKISNKGIDLSGTFVYIFCVYVRVTYLFLYLDVNNEENNETTIFLGNLTTNDCIKCLQMSLPFINSGELIINSNYSLNLLDLMELLIMLFKQEIKTCKMTIKIQEMQEQLKVEQMNIKKSKKQSMKATRKK